VLGRVREVIVAAEHVRDPHVGVVHADGEVVERVPVGAHEHEVVQGIGGELDAPPDQVVHDDRLPWHLEAHDEFLSRADAAVALVRCDVPARAGVTVRASLGLGLLAIVVELLGGLERTKCLALRDQAVGGGPVEVGALRLVVRPLVVLEPEPFEG
jgi:hypothetical protein